MADYEKMTVANLRVLLKDRGIPSTGLTRKAQIVAKLLEEDAAAAAVTAAPAVPSDANGANASPQSKDDATPIEAPVAKSPAQLPDAATEQVTESQTISEAEVAAPSESHESSHIEQTREAARSPRVPESAAEPPSPTALGTKAARSLSQTPLPSKEDPVPPPVAEKSKDSSPMLTRENTAATTQTESDERAKRKRRSGSPSIDTQELAIKRARVAEDVHLKEDVVQSSAEQQKGDVVMLDGGAVQAPSSREEAGREHGVQGIDMAAVVGEATLAVATPNAGQFVEQQRSVTSGDADRGNDKRPKDNRFQDLVTPARSAPEEAPASIDDLPTPSPAIHSASRALYVRNFMRPLQANALKSHIAKLADTDLETIEQLYVNSIRTHAFIVLSSLAIAARIRAGLHNQIWPNERDRKPLWADYVPVEKVPEWIDAEENDTRGPRPGGRKWEVVYETVDDSIVASHVEVGAARDTASKPSAVDASSQQQSTTQAASTQQDAAKASVQPGEVAKPFLTLDKLFKSTTAKPMLYYAPVEASVVDKRLDQIDDATSKRWSSRDWKEADELRRYTYEEGQLVDTGRHNVQRRPADANRGGSSSRYGRGHARGSHRGHWR